MITLLLAVGWTGVEAAALPEPPIPTISERHRSFLSRIACRTIRDRILQRDRYTPTYVPDPLQEQEAEVVVRIRRGGFLLGTAAGGPGPLAIATRDAAQEAAKMLAMLPDADLDLVNRALVEVEVAGELQRLEIEGDWTRPRALLPYVEPGVHGLALVGDAIQHRFTPTELFTNDLVLSEALKRLAQSSHGGPAALKDVDVYRFRTVHWYEDGDTDKVVSLHRGLIVLPPNVVTRVRLDEAIRTLADYMVYRQLESGLFTYQYEPARDRYSDEQNLVRQVGAVVAMAVHAREYDDAASRAAADRGIEFHLQGLTPFPGRDDAAFIATADGRNKLGVTALLCLAMAEHPNAARYEKTRRKLVQGMLALQQPPGVFLTAFPPAVELNAQDYFPGEALVALANHYDHEPSGEVLDAFHRAIRFYREYFRERPSPAFVPWQVQAYALMAQRSRREDYAAFVYELSDWLSAKQLTRANCQWPEMWGGIAAYAPGRAGVSTAAYLEGFADALKLARAAGDDERAQRYEAVVRRAARFVMQLQVRPEEAYFIRSPRDAVGGIRTSPSLNLLRIDHCQHALVGLIKARNALFGDER